MCLVGIALGASSSAFPLVVAANRDEFFVRETAPLDWWSFEQPGQRPGPPILGGRDLRAGGTWLGVTSAGRIALVTNVREPAAVPPNAPSRGNLVPEWLAGDESFDAFFDRIDAGGYAGVNVLALAPTRAGDTIDARHFSNRERVRHVLSPGVHALSNATLDTPWPKVVALQSRIEAALRATTDVSVLSDLLFSALADEALAPDASLPSTGVPLAVERSLSPAFIRMPGVAYGTRSSTLVLGTSSGALHVFERTHPSASAPSTLRVVLDRWPT